MVKEHDSPRLTSSRAPRPNSGLVVDDLVAWDIVYGWPGTALTAGYVYPCTDNVLPVDWRWAYTYQYTWGERWGRGGEQA